MDFLWSPWRMDYIMHHEHLAKCIFCSALEQEDGPQNLVVHRGKLAYVILNRFPYTSGHLMVVSNAHQASFETVDQSTRSEVMELMSRSLQVLREVYAPEGFNVGANIGAAAGAGVADHMHFHVVPRWMGDTNFMSTTATTRVLPEDLAETYRRVRSRWEEIFK